VKIPSRLLEKAERSGQEALEALQNALVEHPHLQLIDLHTHAAGSKG
jgi:hypothetical protein